MYMYVGFIMSVNIEHTNNFPFITDIYMFIWTQCITDKHKG